MMKQTTNTKQKVITRRAHQYLQRRQMDRRTSSKLQKHSKLLYTLCLLLKPRWAMCHSIPIRWIKIVFTVCSVSVALSAMDSLVCRCAYVYCMCVCVWGCVVCLCLWMCVFVYLWGISVSVYRSFCSVLCCCVLCADVLLVRIYVLTVFVLMWNISCKPSNCN